MKKTILLAYLLCLSLFHLDAQVTIGSEIKPNAGALLDLKQYDDTEAINGGRNATKGLLSPRVFLSNANSMSDLNIPTNEYEIHTGLTVYNVNQCLDYGTTNSKGIYVWNGKNWEKLGRKSQSELVFEYTDSRNGEVYLYRKFGDAGTWMLENMRATTYDQGGDAPQLGLPQTHIADYYVKLYAYPSSSSNGDGIDQTLYKMLPAIGLLYSWAAATNNENIPENNSQPENQGQLTIGSTIGANEVENVVSPGNGKGRVQGICPTGWHIPSDREWNELEKELTINASKYSTNTDSQWEEAWEISTTNRGNSGLTLKTPCLPPGISSDLAIGKSFPAAEGGFCLFVTGYYHAGNKRFTDYGNGGFYFCSSSGPETSGSKVAFNRSLDKYTPFVYRAPGGLRNNLMPVRCKKDD